MELIARLQLKFYKKWLNLKKWYKYHDRISKHYYYAPSILPWTKLNYVKNNIFIIFVCFPPVSLSLSYSLSYLHTRHVLCVYLRARYIALSTNDVFFCTHVQCSHINLASKCGQSPNLQMWAAPITCVNEIIRYCDLCAYVFVWESQRYICTDTDCIAVRENRVHSFKVAFKC